MKLKRFLLRYYPPGIILEYEQANQIKTRTHDLLHLTTFLNPQDVAVELSTKDPLITKSKIKQVSDLVSKLQQKLQQVSLANHQYYLFKVLRAHILPLTNIAFNKSGSHRFIYKKMVDITENFEKVNFNYSLKNIPTSNKSE